MVLIIALIISGNDNMARGTTTIPLSAYIRLII